MDSQRQILRMFAGTWKGSGCLRTGSSVGWRAVKFDILVTVGPIMEGAP